MLPDRVSNPGPLTYESGALPIALRGLADGLVNWVINSRDTLYCFKVKIFARKGSLRILEFLKTLCVVHCNLPFIY